MERFNINNDLKIAKVGGATGGSLEAKPIKWAVGDLEIARLVKIRIVLDEVFSTSGVTFRWGISKKNDLESLPDDLLVKNNIENSEFMITGKHQHMVFTNVGVEAEWTSKDIDFKVPLTFIRKALFLTDGSAGIDWGAYLYYIPEMVSSSTMQRLMVKNHA